MDKCEGCPLDLGGKCHYWGYNPDDCTITENDKELLTDFLAEITGDQVEKRLTPSDMTAIKSAIAGEGFFNRLMTVGEAIEEYGSRSNPQIDGLSGTGE